MFGKLKELALKFAHKNAAKWSALIAGLVVPLIVRSLNLDDSAAAQLMASLADVISTLILGAVAMIASKFVADYQGDKGLTTDSWAGEKTQAKRIDENIKAKTGQQ